MKRHLKLTEVSAADRGAACALGNFDGVHLGHQSVLALARAAAGELNCPLGIITFEPHPRQHFAPDAPAFRLMNADARARRLGKLGVEQLYELPFGASLASMTAEEFVQQILVAALGIRHLVIGADFRFGKGRAGDTALLVKMGEKLGFGVTIAPLISDKSGEFSSSAIRQALSDGRPEDAARMLGHWHRIEGRVQKGDQRGRGLGFPTANLAIEGLHQPRLGIYAALVDVLDGAFQGRHLGAASLGTRPTFGDHPPCLEVHLLDFDGDLYGAEISVALVAYLRPELKFDAVDALIVQMHNDVVAAREALTRAI